MAENTRPPGSGHMDTGHAGSLRGALHGSGKLQMAKLDQNRRTTKPPTPMATDRLYNSGMQLISPPPEETLSLMRTSRPTPLAPSPPASHTNILHASKRKRTVPQIPTERPPTEHLQPQEATPNPKPRKQSKRQPISNDSPTRSYSRLSPVTTPSKPQRALIVKSPYSSNPNADFIPDIPPDAPRRSIASARARRTTPIPPYEPPSEVFTPPREVLMTPSVSKSSKRKTNGKQSTLKGKNILKVVIPAPSIKKELPNIDLSAPMPPPSPSDDPLLLSGPILAPSSTPTRPPMEREQRSVGVGTSAPTALAVALELPPPPSPTRYLPPSSSPVDDVDGVQVFDWACTDPEGSTDFSMMDMDQADADVPCLPLFDLNLEDLPASSDAGGWSDSDDDGEARCGDDRENRDEVEGEGEYTGRWKTVKVRTKLDPPSSATRERMEQWGRPITPFPKKIAKLDLLKEVHGAEEAAMKDNDMLDDGDELSESTDEEEEREVREISVPLADDQEDEVSTKSTTTSFEFKTQTLEKPDTMKQASFDLGLLVKGPVTSGGELPDTNNELQENPTDTSLVRTDAAFDGHGDDPRSGAEVDGWMDGEEEEEVEVRQMSVEFDDEQDLHTELRDVPLGESESPGLILSTSTLVDSQEGGVQLNTASPFGEQSCFMRAATSGRYTEVAEPQDTRFVSKSPGAFVVAEAADGDSSDDESQPSFEDAGVVEITSADPRAAARAAAILKQYDYDCFTKVVMRKRRQSYAGADGLKKKARRKTISSAGVVKAKDKESGRRRSMGVIGDRVYIPGSPALTLPELLREAEAEVVTGTPTKGGGVRDSFKTPLLPSRSGTALMSPDRGVDHIGERTWGKDDWKQLDACFTDERLEIGCRLDVGGDEALAHVEYVEVENVVQRFVLLMGGHELVESFGETWNFDTICQRVKALQNKQRSGNVAPPTTPYTPSPGSRGFAATRGRLPMEVPEFTPLARRAPPTQQRPVLSTLVGQDAQCANLTIQQDKSARTVPAPLLAPRYSHLLEEAVAVSQLGIKHPETSVTDVGTDGDMASDGSASTLADGEDDSLPPKRTNHLSEAPATIGKRVKGFLFSYLPTLSKTTSSTTRMRQHKAGLPLPPPEVLEKSRGPISTPIRPPLPKVKPPKELVHLNPAPHPKTSLIPRVRKPQRLVELQPLPPQSPLQPLAIPRPRRSSGSVKDLVRSFEDLEKSREIEKVGVLKRMKSNGDWRTVGLSNKPSWRP